MTFLHRTRCRCTGWSSTPGKYTRLSPLHPLRHTSSGHKHTKTQTTKISARAEQTTPSHVHTCTYHMAVSTRHTHPGKLQGGRRTTPPPDGASSAAVKRLRMRSTLLVTGRRTPRKALRELSRGSAVTDEGFLPLLAHGSALHPGAPPSQTKGSCLSSFTTALFALRSSSVNVGTKSVRDGCWQIFT